MSAPKGGLLLRAAAVTAKLFGLLTVASGGNTLFGSEVPSDRREMQLTRPWWLSEAAPSGLRRGRMLGRISRLHMHSGHFYPDGLGSDLAPQTQNDALQIDASQRMCRDVSSD